MRDPSLTFLGGVHEIGGNKILVEDGDDRLLFDFGPSFSDRFEQFYLNFLQPRSTSPVKDLLEFDLLPRVDGLYSEEALYGADLKYRPPEVHGIFVSHAHLDHAGHLDLVDPSIPVHVGAGTKHLLDAIEGSGSRKYGDHDWRVVEDRRRVKVGSVEVVPFPVDHSIPAAYAFLIHTSEGCIAYTGDFRLHGPRAAQTVAFLEAARAERPIALVMEGTRAGPDPRPNFTEQGVREKVDGLLLRSRRPAFVSCYPRDVDRLTTLYRAAREAERQFVVPLRTAHLLATIAPDLGPEAPVPGRSEGLKVYRRTKKVYYKWERPFLDDGVDADWVRHHPSDVLLSLDLPHFAELIDLQPPKGSPFIHSMSEPFSEDDLDDAVQRNWLEHFGLVRHALHASGHCSGPELHAVARKIAPQAVVPVHTEHPEAFEGAGVPVRAPVKGKRMPLRP